MLLRRTPSSSAPSFVLAQLMLPMLLGLAGCRSTTPEGSTLPSGVEALTDASFAPTRRAFHGLPLDSPQREQDRQRLFAYLDDAGRALLDSQDYEALLEHFATCTDLLVPDDYESGRIPESLAPIALQIVELGSPRGDEGRVLAALEVLRRVVLDGQADAEARYQQVSQWGRTSREAVPDLVQRYTSLIDIWDAHADLTPSISVLDTLAQLHIDRRDMVIRASRESGMSGLLEGYPPSLPLQIGRIAPIDVVSVYMRVGDVPRAILKIREMGVAGRTEAQLLELLQASQSPSRAGADALVELATAFARTRARSSLGICRLGVRMHPRDTRFAECIANVEAGQGDEADAIAWFLVAISLDPQNQALYDEALTLINEFIGREAFDEDPTAGRALARDLRRLIELRRTQFPSLPQPISEAQIKYIEGMVELHAGNAELARQHFMDSLAAEELNVVLRELGRLETRLGNTGAATELLRRALDRTLGDSLQTRILRANLLMEIGEAFELGDNATQARRMYQLALEGYDTALPQLQAEGIAFVQARRGVLLDKLGSREASETAFMAAITAAPLERDHYMVAMMHLSVAEPNAPLMMEIYRRALLNLSLPPEWKVYFALWTQFVVQRAGQEPGEEVTSVLERFARHTPWYGRLAAYGAGELEAGALVSAASTRGQRAEAHYYVATRALTSGDGERAGAEFGAVRETGMVNYVEFSMSQALQER